MNLLDANDHLGCYPDSWYAATATALAEFEPLRGAHQADVCVVGAGFTGLSAALHLTKAGLTVALLDAQRVGFGASGRNGGQLGTGQRMDQDDLLELMGDETGDRLWQLAEDAKNTVKSLIKEHKIDCYLRPGVAGIGFNQKQMEDLHRYAAFLERRYGYAQIDLLDRDATQALCPSPRYYGGILDHGAAHLHPLRYALGLAQAAHKAGVKIFEQSRVQEVIRGAKPIVKTDQGQLRCNHVIIACNGYLGGLEPKVARRVMPINNFIVATEPLGDAQSQVLTRDVAVADTKFVVNYFRKSHDGRLLFGGGENYSYHFPKNIAETVRKPMLEIFPHLSDVKIEYAWGGTLAITVRRMPYLSRLEHNILSASGYSGHGVGTATHAGKMMALAISGDASGFDTMSKVPAMRFPGGDRLRTPLLILAMSWYAMRDRLGL